MRARVVVGNLGTLLRLFALTLVVPVVAAFVFEEATLLLAFGVAIPLAGAFLLGLLLEQVGLSADLCDRDACVLVGIGWISCTIVAAVPYVIAGTIPHPADAFFEV